MSHPKCAYFWFIKEVSSRRFGLLFIQQLLFEIPLFEINPNNSLKTFKIIMENPYILILSLFMKKP